MNQVSDIFDNHSWEPVSGFGFSDITYHSHQSIRCVRIGFNRPEVRNAFRPQTVDELIAALRSAAENTQVGAVIITGNGPSPKDGGWAFCAGGDQTVRGPSGYYGDDSTGGRLHILEAQRIIRQMPKVVIAAVSGWAVGGGHSLHVVCDLTVASRQHGKFAQTDVDVASFDGGYGSALLARQVGQKTAREIFFLGNTYSADQAKDHGAVNFVVDHEDLETRSVEIAAQICEKSPTAIRMAKFALNMCDDGLAGQQVFAGEATRLAYGTDEAIEGRDAFIEKRSADFSKFDYPA